MKPPTETKPVRKSAVERKAERLAAQQAKLDAMRANLATETKLRAAEDDMRASCAACIDEARRDLRGRRYGDATSALRSALSYLAAMPTGKQPAREGAP